ncbi:protein-glutamate O-methyltransferase CheR [Geomonas sp.]|uniref:CheR family methyltransferase n=1 Tax=Geomonas sp. TaxID=2651584 RepID=UPI002B45D6A8|nr:protein-glutamate O-methyltransferase CheR [Geomonas sp.]HJV34632.1 protein-glutamate O-methyltransferase CheR [Geomonas sp.]
MLSQRLRSETDIPPETFEIIGRILKARSGFSLEGYKDQCVKRRIAIRMRATESPSPQAYSDLLTESPAEQELLLRVLTIHVSHFFRNPSTFEKLAEEIIPDLAVRRHVRQLRFTSVGCASGEEPYTLALLMRERFPELLDGERVSILGIDIDQGVLEGAKDGLYHPDRLAEVPSELRSRWFTPQGQRFQLADEIRSLVTFQQGDVNDAASRPASDLILCRNVLIYFERGRQEEILSGFADALGKGGILVLGKSETLSSASRARFRTVCPVERIYRVL